MTGERGYRWVRTSESDYHTDWWFDQTGPRQPNVLYPPHLTAEIRCDGCIDLRRYFDGVMPDEANDDNSDYIHICDLEEFVNDLRALADATKGMRRVR